MSPIIERLRQRRSRLESITFEITPRCNLRCRYCYNVWKRPNADPPFRTSYATAKSTLKRLFGMANIKHVTMTGGEPFLAERFAETVLYCRMKGKTVAIITNGNRASKQDLAVVHDLGVELFEIPLHSAHSEPHDWMTGVKGSWEKARQTLQQVVELRAVPVAVIVLTKANLHEVDDTLSYLGQMGIKRIMLNRFNIGGQGIVDADQLAPSVDELRWAFQTANKAANNYHLRITSNVCTPICVLDPRDYPAIGFSSCGSEPERMPVTVNAIGDVRLCNHSPVIVGNIFQTPMDGPYPWDESAIRPEHPNRRF